MRVAACNARGKPWELWRPLEYLTNVKGNTTCIGPEAGNQQVGISRMQIQSRDNDQGWNGEKVAETWIIPGGVSASGAGI